MEETITRKRVRAHRHTKESFGGGCILEKKVGRTFDLK